jgi:hypothetical protein
LGLLIIGKLNGLVKKFLPINTSPLGGDDWLAGFIEAKKRDLFILELLKQIEYELDLNLVSYKSKIEEMLWKNC